ncbi:MAG: spore coat protein YlbD [Bacilli bacterium]
MQSKMDEFREFVKRHEKVREEVRSGRRTWQNIYEEWVVYGEQDEQWVNYRNKQANNAPIQKDGNNISFNIDSIKNIVGYIQKINPDSLNRTLNSVQKVIQIAQSIGPKGSSSTPFITTPYNDWWD